MTALTTFLDALRQDGTRLEADFDAICATGGRLQGTESAARAFVLVEGMLDAIGAGTLRTVPTAYHGWTMGQVSITIPGEAEAVPAASLVGGAPTPSDGIELEVVDLGRGTPDEIHAAADRVRGCAVLVRHEYAFATDTLHRRVKLKAATEVGAAAVVMVQPFEGYGPVAGGANLSPMPCLGVGIEGARRLVKAGRARFFQSSEHHRDVAPNLILDIPGAGPGWTVLSAHLDGHALGESAIDNATGVAALVSLARTAAPLVAKMRRGLRVCVFGAEEWSLSGSRSWLGSLSDDEVREMGFNLNLDSIAGSPNLTALTSGFPALGAFVQEAVRSAGHEIGVHLPISVSSDHANFAGLGIPALRIIAGFNEPECALSRLLTAADTRSAVPLDQLRQATEVAGAILWRALSAGTAEFEGLKIGALDVSAAVSVLSPLPT